MKMSTSLVICCLAAPALWGAGASQASLVKRGQYLVGIMGCNDCHTPMKMGPHGPEHDQTLLLSGHPAGLQMPPAPGLGEGPWVWIGAGTNTAFAGPWGVSYTANLTPDKETGLGSWSEADFLAMARSGKHLGKGRDILPPMPWEAVHSASISDQKALFAYLRSLKPIHNPVPDPVEPAQP